MCQQLFVFLTGSTSGAQVKKEKPVRMKSSRRIDFNESDDDDEEEIQNSSFSGISDGMFLFACYILITN